LVAAGAAEVQCGGEKLHRHSGAMPTGPREARPDDRLRIEPGISRFPDAQLRI
jgi:hypothetical protein